MVGAFIGPVILSSGMRLRLQWAGPSAGRKAAQREPLSSQMTDI